MIHDLVVIGGGVGGLTAAAYAAKRGLRVIVCEQNPMAGGMLAPYRQEGFRFDLRMPTLMNMGIVLPVLDELGIDGDDLRRRSDWQIILPRGEVSVNSLQSALEQLSALYPDQARPIQQLTDDLGELASTFQRFFDPNPFFLHGFRSRGSWALSALASFSQIYCFWRASKLTVDEGLRRYRLSEELRSIFVQLSYEPMSFLLLAGLWQTFATDYFLPPAGISQLPMALEQKMRSVGGELATEAKVVGLLIRGGRAVGVRLADGRTIEGRSVIAACDLVSLYGMLTDLKPFARIYAQALVTPVTQSYISLFLGISQRATELPFRATHTFWLPDCKAMAATELPDFRRRGLIISSPSRQGPGFAPQEAATLVVSTPATLSWFREMNGEMVRHQVAEGLIGQITERWPQLRGQIMAQRLLTPADYQRMTANHLGASAGWSMDPHLSTPTGLVPWRTPLPGLYLAGHWTARPGGVAGAMLTARMAAEEIASQSKR